MDDFLLAANDRATVERTWMLPEASYTDSAQTLIALPAESVAQWKRRCYEIQQRDPCAFWGSIVAREDRRGRHARHAATAAID